MAKKTIHAIVKGKVQGVYFRDYARKEADRFGLVGWIRNLRNGSVEAVITGDSDKVDQIIAWLHTGSPMSVVTSVTTKEHKDDESFPDFSIRY